MISREQLQSIEWAIKDEDGGSWCPACASPADIGHKCDCWLARALAAPPADAGAPPALVALVAKLRVPSGGDVTRYRAGWNDALDAVLGSPAPAPFAVVGVDWASGPDRSVELHAPVAPPAETFEPPMGVCQWLDEGSDYTTECGHGWQFIDGGVELNDAKFCPFCGGKIQVVDERPAPPAVAGGDAPPEIQVGDVVWHKDPDHGHDCMTWVRDAGHVRYVGDPAKTVIAIYREPLWRRRQEGQ